MRADKFEGDPHERRRHARQLDAAARYAIDRQRETAGEHAPRRADQQQNPPPARDRQPAVNAKHGCNPRHGSHHKQQRVEEATGERDATARTEHRQQQRGDTNPGINAKVQPGEGERQCRAGYRRDRQAQPIRYLRPGLGSNQRGPGESRHQRFTKALKPAASRPFRAASVAFKSA